MTDTNPISQADAPILEKVGYNIRKYRKLKGLTQNELADISTLSRSHLQRYEVGTINQSIIGLHRIADTLGITLSDLVEGV